VPNASQSVCRIAALADWQIASYLYAMKGSKPALGFIFVTILIDVIGFGIIIPVVPKLINSLVGGTMSDAADYGGWLISAFAVMQFLFSPILGNLSDQYGRRPILLISLFGFGLDYLFTAFAPSIIWLFVGRIIAGITGASFTTATAYIADISTPETRAQNFGLIGAAFGLGFIIGPAIGGPLADLGPKVPFFAAAGLTLINWLYGYFVLPESLAPENRRTFSWSNGNPLASFMNLKKYPAVSGLVGAFFLLYLASHAVQTTWSYYNYEKFKWNGTQVGVSLTVVGVMVALVQGVLIRKIIPKIGQTKSVLIGLLFYCLGMVLFALASQGWMMYVFTIVYCLGGIAGPALQGYISGHIPANEQGGLQGSLTGLISFSSIIGPPMMSKLFSWFTKPGHIYFPGAPFMAGAIILAVSAVLAYRTMNKEHALS
jgi:MFS transporter, DHA1 family, tetracycline resistance protein